MMLTFPPQILSNRALIRLSGEGVLAFLHNLLTMDVEHLTEGQIAYGALLSPQGKIQHEVFVHNHGRAVLLDCVRAQRDDLLQKLKLYRLRAKIEITVDDTGAVAVSCESVGGIVGADPRLHHIGLRGIVPAGSLPVRGTCAAAQMALGLAEGEHDIGSNLHFPHEANFDLLNGVNFRKGCYVGQEVVSRMEHRGAARSRMLPVMLEGEAPDGSAIVSGDKPIGNLLSSMGRQGLALVRLDRLAEAEQPLLSGGVRTHVRKPDWMTIDMTIPEVAQ